MANAIRPRTWWRAAWVRPRMPKVTRRLTAVLATAVSSRLTAFAACAATTLRRSRYSSRYAAVLATPIRTNLASWPPSRRPGPSAAGRSCALRSSGTRIVPPARPVPSRTMPRRSPRAVATTLTRESGSSIQSTGTSWIRSPARSASTSSSVSKNQPVSVVSGSRTRAASARMALNPHCASEKRVPSDACSSRL